MQKKYVSALNAKKSSKTWLKPSDFCAVITFGQGFPRFNSPCQVCFFSLQIKIPLLTLYNQRDLFYCRFLPTMLYYCKENVRAVLLSDAQSLKGASHTQQEDVMTQSEDFTALSSGRNWANTHFDRNDNLSASQKFKKKSTLSKDAFELLINLNWAEEI